MSLAPSSASFSTTDLTLAKPEPSTVFSAGTIGIVASNMSPSRNSGSRSVYCRDALIRFRSPLPGCSAMPVCTNTLAIIGFFGIGVNSPSFIRPSKNEREALTVRMDSLSMVTRATTGLEYSRCMRLFATNSRAIIVRGLTRLSPFNTKRSGRFRSVNSRSCSYESNKLVRTISRSSYRSILSRRTTASVIYAGQTEEMTSSLPKSSTAARLKPSSPVV